MPRFSMFHLRRMRRLRRDENGMVSVEMAIVAPLFLLLIFGVFEIAQYQMLESDVHNTVRTVGRQVAVGGISAANAVTAINDTLSGWGGTPTTTVNDDGTDVTVIVSLPTSTISTFAFLDIWASLSADVTLTFRKE